MAKPTRQELQLINTATELLNNPYPKYDQMVFMPSDLAQITFPHSDPGDIPIWTRQNGNQVFFIRPAAQQGKIIGYPYGPIPRLLMHWITTELQHSSEPVLTLGDSLSSFMKELGLDPHRGGVRSDRMRCQKQLQRFFRSVYSNEYDHTKHGKKGFEYSDIQIAPKGKLWWEFNGNDQTVFDGTLKLSEEALEMFRKSPIPGDLRILNALKSSSLSLDYNDWLHLKTFIANKKDLPQRVPWRGLIMQFGGSYGAEETISKSHISNFRRKSKWAIQCVTGLCPYLDVDYFDGGVIIKPATLPLDIKRNLSK